MDLFSFTERISCTIVAGGCTTKSTFSTVEVLTKDLGTIRLPNLPKGIDASSMVLHNGTILLCGGTNNEIKCLQLDRGTWKEHSTFNQQRLLHSTVTTKSATFVFGGIHSKTTYEYLQKDSTSWLMGKNEIPKRFEDGCAIAVKSEKEIWLIGGNKNEKRILSFNVNDHTFQELPIQLNVERDSYRCAFIPKTNKIFVTGGFDITGPLDSTEIIDTENGSVTITTIPMNCKRFGHGIGIVTINEEDQLAIFGGMHDWLDPYDSVEFYNTEEEKWEKMDIKLNEPKYYFGFLTIKLSDIISKF